MSRPWTVILDLTDRCNLRCTMCYFSAVDRLRFEPFDRSLAETGHMTTEVFEDVARRFFSRAREVALGCAAEPLIHKRFGELVRIAGRYRIPNLWFPTNLLALNRDKAEAIVEAGVRRVAVSVDGTDAETYERIRVGGRFAVLEEKLALLNEVRRGSRTELRLIFTWMRSNREHLQRLPEFAARHGASEIDVRFVVPTVGVDNRAELLTDEDPEQINEELWRAFRDGVRRGLRFMAYPDFRAGRDESRDPLSRLSRLALRVRGGLYRWDLLRFELARRRNGCAYPTRQYVVRPNGAVAPCVFWEAGPLGLIPDEATARIDDQIRELRDGLRCDRPIGTCAECSERRAAFYRPLRRAGGRVGSAPQPGS